MGAPEHLRYRYMDVPEHRIKATMASVLEVLVLECYGIDRAR